MSKVLKRLYLGDVVKSFGTKQLRKLTTEEPTESIVGTWVFNDVLVIDIPTTEFNITFTANTTENETGGVEGYELIKVGNYSTWYALSYRPIGSTFIGNWYESDAGGWKYNPQGKTITITGGKDITNETFKTWLKSNATKQ